MSFSIISCLNGAGGVCFAYHGELVSDHAKGDASLFTKVKLITTVSEIDYLPGLNGCTIVGLA
jgi:hypothetical protein